MIRILIPIMTSILVSGCLEFGDDIRLAAPDVTASELGEVTRRTGIDFPPGTVGLGYFFMGSGIDDALAIKVAIAAKGKDKFLENALFQDGGVEACSLQIGQDWWNIDWWNIDRLTDRKDYKMNLPQGRFLECVFGEEGGRWIAYIYWMST